MQGGDDLPLGTAITPNIEQFQQLAASPDTGPVVMINLLKFRNGERDAEGSGVEEYRRYGDVALEIGTAEEDWDAVALVEYPSRAAFIAMVSSPEYLAAHAHRERALERTIVIACTPAPFDAPS